MSLITGTHERYQWLSADHEIDALLHECPGVVIGKYLVVTAADSAHYKPSVEETGGGWRTRGNLSFSPRIERLDSVPTVGFTEFYIFNEPQFVQPEKKFGHCEWSAIQVFVNTYGFGLHVGEMGDIIESFWKQITTIDAESYVADASHCLSFVTRDPSLFECVHRGLEKALPRWYRLA